MKKTLIWILAVLGVIVVADLAVGAFFNWHVRTNDLGGDYTSFEHLLKDFNEDGLVIGSSVALNSIDTRQLSDSLGYEVFNGGSNGQALPYFLTVHEVASANHTPRHVLIGLRPNELTGSGMGQRYNLLAPYYGMGFASIDEGLENLSEESHFLMKSNLYRFNTIWFRIMLYGFITPNEVGQNGFIAKPIPTIFPTMKDVPDEGPLTEERKAQMERLVRECSQNGAEVVLFFPPQYYRGADTTETVAYVTERWGNLPNVKIFNDLNHPLFANDSTLYYDNVHLNHRGATLYTQIMAERLRR